MKSTFVPNVALVALSSLGLFLTTMQARANSVTVVVDPVSYDIQALANPDSENFSDETTGPPPSLPQSIFVQIPQGAPTNYVVNGSAGVTVSGYPAIAVSASLSNSSNPNCCAGSASAFGDMSYYFIVSEKAGFTDSYTNIPVLFNGNAGQSSSDSSNTGTTSTSVSMTVNAVNDSNLLADLPSDTNGRYNGNLQITPNLEYLVSMSASVYISSTTGSVGASIDPVFTIDPNFAGADAYELTFSDGILNEFPPSSTPIPAALPLFGTGLGGLLLLGRRKKKKAAALLS